MKTKLETIREIEKEYDLDRLDDRFLQTLDDMDDYLEYLDTYRWKGIPAWCFND